MHRIRPLAPVLLTLAVLLATLGVPSPAHAAAPPTIEIAAWPDACSGVTITGAGFEPNKGVVISAHEEHSDSAAEIPNGRPVVGKSGTFEVQFTDFPATCEAGTTYLFNAATLNNGKLGDRLTDDVRYDPSAAPLPANAGTGPASEAPLPTARLALLALAATLLLTATARRATGSSPPR